MKKINFPSISISQFFANSCADASLYALVDEKRGKSRERNQTGEHGYIFTGHRAREFFFRGNTVGREREGTGVRAICHERRPNAGASFQH